jgi:hypothetical protein
MTGKKKVISVNHFNHFNQWFRQKYMKQNKTLLKKETAQKIAFLIFRILGIIIVGILF